MQTYNNLPKIYKYTSNKPTTFAAVIFQKA